MTNKKESISCCNLVQEKTPSKHVKTLFSNKLLKLKEREALRNKLNRNGRRAHSGKDCECVNGNGAIHNKTNSGHPKKGRLNFKNHLFSVKNKLKKTFTILGKLHSKGKYVDSSPLNDRLGEPPDSKSSTCEQGGTLNTESSSLVSIANNPHTFSHRTAASRGGNSPKMVETTNSDNADHSKDGDTGIHETDGTRFNNNKQSDSALSQLLNTGAYSSDKNKTVPAHSQVNLHEIIKDVKVERNDEYLSVKFGELEECKRTLNEYLSESESECKKPSCLDSKYDGNMDRRKSEYAKLARKLSDVSFECLLTNPNDQLCQLFYNKDGVKVWKKENKGGRVLIRTEFLVPVSPIEYLEYVTDSRNRRIYDNSLLNLKILEQVFPGLDIIYAATKRIATVYPRDIVNIRFIHGFSIKDGLKIFTREELGSDENRNNQENFIFCSCSCSIKHPDAPERQGFVRMDLSIGSYVAIPIKTPFGIWSSIAMFNEVSPRGWIPSSVTKIIAAKMVPGSVENIISSMLNYYKLPYRNKISRPYSSFCNRVFSTLYTEYNKCNDLNCATNSDHSVTNIQKSSKHPYSKLSFLFYKPLLMSIHEFIALYKSNSLTEFVEQFNGVYIISRIIRSIKLISSSLNHIDLVSPSTDASRQISLEFANSKSIDSNINILLMLQKQDSNIAIYNISSDHISINLNSGDSNAIGSSNVNFEKSSSSEFLETASTVDTRKKRESRFHLNDIESKYIRISFRRDSGGFLKVFGSSQIFDMSDPETLSFIFISG